jgi:hypothetical protein
VALIKHKAVLYQCNRFMESLNAQYKGKLPANLVAPCAGLVKDLGLLSQSWSVMAGRNLMNDILRLLAQVEPLVVADLKKDCADAKAQVTKILQGHVLTAGRYDAVLCLGYKVKTAGPAYSGKVDDWADMKQRCDDMKSAITSAYALADAEGGYNGVSTVLKVFMAPEFFFRGQNGAYDLAVIDGEAAIQKGPGGTRVDAKPGILELMRQEIDKDIYKDWLFVLGTAIGATRTSRTVCSTCGSDVKYVPGGAGGKTVPVCKRDDKHRTVQEEDVGATIDNVAFVCKEREVHTISKELVSRVDFVVNPSVKNLVRVQTDQGLEVLDVNRHVQPSGYNAASDVPSKFKDERMGGCIFTIDGVTFGLEVCLDHAATTDSASSGRLEHAANIQVQLIPSAGMSIKELRTVPDGIVFNVDGSTPHVQVVGGGSGEFRYDYNAKNGTEWELRYPTGVAWTPGLNVTELAKTTPLPKWTALPSAPKTPLTSGASGSVLLYGPYDLP